MSSSTNSTNLFEFAVVGRLVISLFWPFDEWLEIWPELSHGNHEDDDCGGVTFEGPRKRCPELAIGFAGAPAASVWSALELGQPGWGRCNLMRRP